MGPRVSVASGVSITWACSTGGLWVWGPVALCSSVALCSTGGLEVCGPVALCSTGGL